MTDVPHELHDRLLADRKHQRLLPLPGVAVAAGRHADAVTEVVVGHDRCELIEVRAAVGPEQAHQPAAKVNLGRLDDAVGPFWEMGELEGNRVRVGLAGLQPLVRRFQPIDQRVAVDRLGDARVIQLAFLTARATGR
jgi:hypothetical protein